MIEAAIAKATDIINLRTKDCLVYTRGVNDCVAFLIEYDKALRGDSSVAGQHIDFEWRNARDFTVKLYKSGYSLASYMEFCDYKIVRDARPILGDVAFEGGAMIVGVDGWTSTTEMNRGVYVKRRVRHREPNLHFLARPTRR